MRTLGVASVLMVLAAGLGTGCATGKDSPGPADAIVEEEGTGTQDLEGRLAKIVRRDIEAEERAGVDARNEVIRRKPYYFKEYAEFPQGSDNLAITLYETESRSAPYRADVRFPKVRFATKLQRRRETARTDDNFLRHTGHETQAFELRNGRWVRLGSTFVAEKTEQRVDGTWQAVVEQPKVFAEPEDEPGFFGRIFGRSASIL